MGDEEKESSLFLDETQQWINSFRHRFPVSSLKDAGIGFYDALICRSLVVDVAEAGGRIVCSMKVPANICNSGHRLHGGAITSLIDMVGSAAIFATGAQYSGVSVEINVTFMDAVPIDEDVEIEAQVLRIGKNLAVVTVDIRMKATGKIVVQGRHTKFIGGQRVLSKL